LRARPCPFCAVGPVLITVGWLWLWLLVPFRPEAIRFHPAVADVFAALHNVPPTELLVSFDALSIHVPGEQTPGGEKCGFFRAPWWHTDQGPAPTGLKHAGGGEPDYCVQGQVVLNGARSCDATLGILDGSHLHWREFFETFPAKDPRADWQQLDSANPAHVEFFTSRGCAVVRVAAPEGSMVLWDSRAMHCGVEPERGRPAPYPQRMVTYMCMLPRPHPSTKGLGTLLARRRTAYEEARVTSHHPFRWHTFPMKPRTYGEEEPDVLRPTVDPLEELPPRARALVDGGLEYTMQVAAAQGGSRPARKRAGGGGGSGSRKRSCVVDLTADTDSDSS